jgi:hypothetical protein
MNRFQSRLYFVIYVFIDCVCSCPKRKSFVPKQFSVVENTSSLDDEIVVSEEGA